MKINFPLFNYSCLMFLVSAAASHAVTTVWTIPNAATGLLESESGDAQADQGAYSFHGVGGGAADLAGGFQTQNVTNTGAATMVDAATALTFNVGDTINMQFAAGSFNVGGGSGFNGNNVLQFGITSTNVATDSAFAADSLFFNGLEGVSSFLNNVDVQFGIANELGLVSGNTNIGTANIAHSFAGTSNNLWAVGVSFTRNADDSISWGLALDEFSALGAGPYTYTEDLTLTGTLSAAEHGLDFSTNSTYYAALGFEVNDRAQLAVSGASYDWSNDVEVRFVPEPSSSILLSIFCSIFVWRRRR